MPRSEKGCMNTTDELHQKVRLTPRVPRVVIKSNSQHGQQDPQNQDARSSWEPSCDSKSYGEICNNTVDHRISGVLSAVEQQNTTRENKFKRLIEKFENHTRKEIIYSGLETDGEDQQVQRTIGRLDRRHEQHRDLRILRKFFQTAMLWLHCLLGNRRRKLQLVEVTGKSTRSPTEIDQNNRDVTSIPGYGDQEIQKPWSHARSFWTTKDVLPCETDA